MPKVAKAKKDPNAPKRPLSAYMLFASEMRPVVLKKNPGIKFGDVGRMLGDQWKSADEATKAKFNDMAAKAKAKYEKEKEAYLASK